MEEQQCTGRHEHHMCTIAQEHQIETIKQLTTEPKYICVLCGRVANADDNLCKPVHVDSITLM